MLWQRFGLVYAAKAVDMTSAANAIKASKVKKRLVIEGVLALGAGAIVLAGCAATNAEQAALQAQARITREAAEQAALAKTPGGRIKQAELDSEDGKLIWWFDIATPGSKEITEVNVDAVTGGVISVATEVSEP
jgi:uncharacterized membrane protein YkoI